MSPFFIKTPTFSVAEMKFVQVMLGTTGGQWSVAHPWWEPSLRFLQAALLLCSGSRENCSLTTKTKLSLKQKGSKMPSQQRENAIKATHSFLVGNRLVSLTSIQEVGPVDDPESLQDPVQGFLCQR